MEHSSFHDVTLLASAIRQGSESVVWKPRAPVASVRALTDALRSRTLRDPIAHFGVWQEGERDFISPEQWSELGEALARTPVEEIDFFDDTPNADAHALAVVLPVLERNETLRSVSVGGRRVTDACAEAVARAFALRSYPLHSVDFLSTVRGSTTPRSHAAFVRALGASRSAPLVTLPMKGLAHSRRLHRAMESAAARLAVEPLYSLPLVARSAGTPAHRFVVADGDHALLVRIVAFLFGTIPRPE